MMARMGVGETEGDPIVPPDTARRLRHDIREHATAISWAAAELLEDGQASPRQLALLSAIADAAAALVRVADARLT
jgi:hypothetical protein